MRRCWTGWGALVMALQLLSVAAVSAQERPRRLQLSGGLFNAGRSPAFVEGGLELSRPLRWLGLDLAGGVSATEEGAVWGYLGLRREFAAGERVVITPAFAAALYEQGDGKDLGGSIQFRSALSLDFRLSRRTRLGVTAYHMSNAGLEELNPGSNSAVLTYSIAFR